jgi:hypothetical protein
MKAVLVGGFGVDEADNKAGGFATRLVGSSGSKCVES